MSEDADPSRDTGNMLLDALGDADRRRILASAEMREIEVGTVLLRPGDAMKYVPFPVLGTLSMVTQPLEAAPVEAATIGREGAAALHPRWARERGVRSSCARWRARC